MNYLWCALNIELKHSCNCSNKVILTDATISLYSSKRGLLLSLLQVLLTDLSQEELPIRQRHFLLRSFVTRRNGPMHIYIAF